MSNIDQHDQQGKDAVSRAYQDARDSDSMLPPPALDDAIRAAARRAVHAGPQPLGKSWVRKWTPQLAVAAVVVLSVSVVFVSVEERPDLAPAPIQTLALKRKAEAPAAVLAPLETKVLQEIAPVPQQKRDANDAREFLAKKAPAESAVAAADSQFARESSAAFSKQESTTPRAAAPRPSLSAAITPAAPPVYAPPAPPAMASPPAPAVRHVPPPEVINITPAKPFPGTVADAVAPTRKEARADAGAVAVAAAEPKRAREKVEVSGSRIAATGSLRSRDTADMVANAPAKPASPAAMPAPTAATTTAPAPPPPTMKQLAPTPAPAAPSPVRALEFDAARRNAQVAEAEAVRAIGEDKYKLADRLVEDQRPGPWLKRMLDMREQGKLKALREEVLRFKKRHPDVVLPKTLAELPPE